MSHGTICLRCRKYVNDCICRHQVPSGNGVDSNVRYPTGWREWEYMTAFEGRRHAPWCPVLPRCLCKARRFTLTDPRPELVSDALDRYMEAHPRLRDKITRLWRRP